MHFGDMRIFHCRQLSAQRHHHDQCDSDANTCKPLVLALMHDGSSGNHELAAFTGNDCESQDLVVVDRGELAATVWPTLAVPMLAQQSMAMIACVAQRKRSLMGRPVP
jgi:hypothetical protein